MFYNDFYSDERKENLETAILIARYRNLNELHDYVCKVNLQITEDEFEALKKYQFNNKTSTVLVKCVTEVENKYDYDEDVYSYYDECDYYDEYYNSPY